MTRTKDAPADAGSYSEETRVIKHRFILRSYEEAEIFAAIPTERQVLKWERLETPTPIFSADVFKNAVHGHCEDLGLVSNSWLSAFDAEREIDAICKPLRQQVAQMRRAIGQLGKAEKREHLARLARTEVDVNARIVLIKRSFDPLMEQVGEFQEIGDQVRRELSAHVEALAGLSGGPGVAAATVEAAAALGAEIVRKLSPCFSRVATICMDAERTSRNPETIRAVIDAMREVVTTTMTVVIRATKWQAVEFCSTPEFNPECPVGIPFACYTVEIPMVPVDERRTANAIVNVVGGHAWSDHFQPGVLNDRQATLVRRVVEMVTQMLTERAAHPDAETRVIVRDLDPAHATRARRDVSGKPRTIKCEVSPPRYLREAAHAILGSTVRAHWVIGHWRSQPWGNHRRLRRQQWIAPHIRGLGEAGPVVAKVSPPNTEGGAVLQ